MLLQLPGYSLDSSQRLVIQLPAGPCSRLSGVYRPKVLFATAGCGDHIAWAVLHFAVQRIVHSTANFHVTRSYARTEKTGWTWSSLSDEEIVVEMARDAKNFKATPVDDYRRKIGHHDRKVVQKDVKQHQRQTEKKRNFGESVKQTSYIILGVLGIVVIVSCIVYGALVRAPV